MSRVGTVTGRLIVAAAIWLGIGGCGGSATPTAMPSASPSPLVTAAATPSEEPTASLSASPSPSASAASRAAADTFVSDRYRYSLALPPGTLLLNWHSADRAWDGQAKVDMAGPFTDRASIAEGGLYVIGAEAQSLDEFATRFEENGTRFHGCTAAQDRTDVTIGGVPAIAFTQRCDHGAVGFGRVALFKDGFGLGTWISTLPGTEAAALDHLIELLGALEWQTG